MENDDLLRAKYPVIFSEKGYYIRILTKGMHIDYHQERIKVGFCICTMRVLHDPHLKRPECEEFAPFLVCAKKNPQTVQVLFTGCGVPKQMAQVEQRSRFWAGKS